MKVLGKEGASFGNKTTFHREARNIVKLRTIVEVGTTNTELERTIINTKIGTIITNTRLAKSMQTIIGLIGVETNLIVVIEET